MVAESWDFIFTFMNKSKHIRIAMQQIAEKIWFVKEKRLTFRTVHWPIFYLFISEFDDFHYIEWTKKWSQRIMIKVCPNTLEDKIIEICNLHW